MLGTDLSQFLQEFPFAMARQLAEHFNESKHTIKTILDRELGLQKFSRRWVPHSISDSQNFDRMRKTRYMLDVLQEQTDKSFNWTITGDEPWFVFLSLSDHIFAFGRASVIPREKQTIASRTVMFRFFFSGPSLISLDALRDDQTYTQEHFIHDILPDLANKKRRIWRRHQAGSFSFD
jgi:hypothetical protein